MRGSQLIYDGLWRCLCPAVDGPALRRAVCLRTPLMAQPSRPTTSCTRFTQTRQISAARLRELAEAKLRAPPHIEHEIPRAARLLTPKPPTKETLRDASVEEIFAALVTIRDPRGWTFHGQEVDRHDRIVLLVKHLLSSRGRTPNPFLYECMMDAMVYPQGSVKGIRKLIDDMASQNLKLTATMCQSALAALANHPDYTLRQEILDTMQDFWFTVDTTAQQKVVLGLLRDEQYELAYTRLTQMIEKKAVIPTWVFDIFIMVFGKVGFVDEMMLLLYRRKTIRSNDDALSSILYYVLDVCSSSFHLPGTLFAWNSVVRNSLLQPADGIVENVLATAARHGDASLATEALDMLSQRTRVQAYHYEAVSEAFTATGDVTGAFRTLCIMEKNGMRIGRRNTRAVYEALRRHSKLIGDAERAVRSMAQEEEGLPAAVVGVVIEAIAETQGSEAAMDLYRDVGALCGGEHVNATVMQTLLINSHDKTTLAIVKDYSTQIAEGDDPVREAHVYGQLVTKCAEAGALDLAFRFANQLLGMEGARGDGDWNWVKVLVSKAAEKEDKRIWGVVDELRKDEEMGALVGRVLRQMRITRRASLRV